MGGKIKATRVGVPCGLGPEAKEHHERRSREKEQRTTNNWRRESGDAARDTGFSSSSSWSWSWSCYAPGRSLSGLQEAGSTARSSIVDTS